MNEITSPVAVEVDAYHPLTALDAIAGPWTKDADIEGTVSQRAPRVNIVPAGQMNEVIFAVVVEVAHAPGATLDSVSRPGLEVAYGECSVTVRQPGMDVVARG